VCSSDLGHWIVHRLHRALSAWGKATGSATRYIFKGENPYTDQFSIFEGLDDSYPETAFNEGLYASLAGFDRLTFAGEALSHCVKESIFSYMRKRREREQKTPHKQKVSLLTDCTSSVAGFDAQASLEELRDAGVELALSTDFIS
jgi:nicotinamidase-related amidase